LAGVPGLDKVGCGALGVSQSSESGHLQKYKQSDGMSIQTLLAATLEYWVPFFRVSDFISVVKGVPQLSARRLRIPTIRGEAVAIPAKSAVAMV
jgi:hypothetical protein